MENIVKIENIFRLTARKKIVLSVIIIQGQIKSGMTIKKDHEGLFRVIDSVEFIDSGATHIGLTFDHKYSDTELFNTLKIGDLLKVE